jgi:hypothetical protein
MSRCGCDAYCACFLEGGGDVTVTGAGSEASPYVISATAPTPAPDYDLATFSRNDVLATGTGASRFLFPFAATVIGVTAAVGTAPTGASIIVDVNRNGTTIFTTQANRPTIVAAANATASEAVPDVTAVASGDYLTVDRDQVGSATPGSDLTVFVRYQRTGQ